MELPFVEHFVRELQVRADDIGAYPESATALAPQELDQFATRYLESAALYRQQAPRFLDKMPNNFVHIGLIHRAVRRMPVARLEAVDAVRARAIALNSRSRTSGGAVRRGAPRPMLAPMRCMS
jgi:hypothetical protein